MFALLRTRSFIKKFPECVSDFFFSKGFCYIIIKCTFKYCNFIVRCMCGLGNNRKGWMIFSDLYCCGTPIHHRHFNIH